MVYANKSVKKNIRHTVTEIEAYLCEGIMEIVTKIVDNI